MTLHRIFFFLLVVFLPTQLGLHGWPDWAFILGRRVDYLSPTVYFTDLLVVAMVASWFIKGASSIKNHITSMRATPQQCMIPLLTLLFVGINIFYSISRPVAIYKWFKVLEMFLLAVYIIRTKPSVSHVVYFLSIGVLYSSMIATGQFFLQRSIGGLLWWLGERAFTIDTPGIARITLCGTTLLSCRLMLRSYATFPHPNVLGGFLAAVLPLLYYQYSTTLRLGRGPLPRMKIVYMGSLAIGIGGLFLSMSRSAILVGSAMLLYFIFLRAWIHRKATLTDRSIHWKHVLLVVLFLVISVLAPLTIRRMIPDDESIVVRNQLNQAAVKIFLESPLVGVGLGNFLITLPQALPSRGVYFLQPVHNIYLLVLSETGAIGFLLFIWLIVRSTHKLKWHLLFSAPSFTVSLFVLLIIGLVDHYSLTLQQGQLLFTIFLAMSVSKVTA